MVAEVLALRADGYRTALVTNNVREASDSWRQMLALDDLFDVVIDSSSVGVRKPDARIYLLALEQLGDVEPARAVFLDDHPGNVPARERAGLAAVLVDDPAVAIAELRVLLGRSPDGAEPGCPTRGVTGTGEHPGPAAAPVGTWGPAAGPAAPPPSSWRPCSSGPRSSS